jgi:hypothetical protein
MLITLLLYVAQRHRAPRPKSNAHTAYVLSACRDFKDFHLYPPAPLPRSLPPPSHRPFLLAPHLFGRPSRSVPATLFSSFHPTYVIRKGVTTLSLSLSLSLSLPSHLSALDYSRARSLPRFFTSHEYISEIHLRASAKKKSELDDALVTN